jgi:CheY-like chemotaxis protein
MPAGGIILNYSGLGVIDFCMGKEANHKILVLDDDADWLDMCRDFLAQLPAKPVIRTVTSGMQALSLLDTESYQVLLCDLVMPRMDGLQVLSIVRRRFPGLRTVVLTGHPDDVFRARAYEVGVDLFWLKSDLQQSPQLFLDCIESLLGREEDDGFRDVQSKNILDVIRMELALRNSSTLHIKSGRQVAQICIQDGQIIDVRAEGADGEEAFRRLLKWKGGTFESLPAEYGHVQTMNKSLEALILESAQTLKRGANQSTVKEDEDTKFITRMTAMACEGAEFVVIVPVKKEDTAKGFGSIQEVDRLAAWTRQAEKTAQRLGERYGAGSLTHLAGHNLERRLLLVPGKGRTFVIGWPLKADLGQLFEQSKKLAESWAS